MFTENYRIPFRLRWEYGTVPVAFSTTDTVPYLQTLRNFKQQEFTKFRIMSQYSIQIDMKKHYSHSTNHGKGKGSVLVA